VVKKLNDDIMGPKNYDAYNYGYGYRNSNKRQWEQPKRRAWVHCTTCSSTDPNAAIQWVFCDRVAKEQSHCRKCGAPWPSAQEGAHKTTSKGPEPPAKDVITHEQIVALLGAGKVDDAKALLARKTQHDDKNKTPDKQNSIGKLSAAEASLKNQLRQSLASHEELLAKVEKSKERNFELAIKTKKAEIELQNKIAEMHKEKVVTDAEDTHVEKRVERFLDVGKREAYAKIQHEKAVVEAKLENFAKDNAVELRLDEKSNKPKAKVTEDVEMGEGQKPVQSMSQASGICIDSSQDAAAASDARVQRALAEAGRHMEEQNNDEKEKIARAAAEVQAAKAQGARAADAQVYCA
jgi:hypothetical protein